MGGMSRDDDLGALLKPYDPEVVETARALRALVVDACPGATEIVQLGWKAVTYTRGGAMKGAICAIGLHKGWVNLQFPQGTSLGDPGGLLEGTGKAMRHVKVRSADGMDEVALSALVLQADELVR